jgi:hypothetical protein
LIRAGLLTEDPEGRIASTPRGAIVATAGIGIDTAIGLIRALEAASDFDPALWIALFTTLPETAEARLPSGAPRCGGVGTAIQRRFSRRWRVGSRASCKSPLAHSRIGGRARDADRACHD